MSPSTALAFPEPHADAPVDAHTAERIASITAVCLRAAQGDLEARISGLGDDPEWRELATAINRMLDIADSFVREAAAAMDHCSRDLYYRPVLTRGLTGAYRKSAGVINQAGLKMKESSDQIRFVAGMANETAKNVGSVAAACEELTVTSNEISRQSRGSATLSEEAVTLARNANAAVHELRGAAREVTGVVGLITTIADQTKLLALNAAIEAVHAGEAGKGFGVVASEVKALARGTADATQSIDHQVERITSTVSTVAAGMQSIEAAIARVSERAEEISRAVGEQVLATAEITRSITDISKNTDLISKRIGSVGQSN